VPSGVIPKKEMIALLTDVHLIESYTSTIGQDSAKQVSANLYESVFKKFSTDSIQFKKSIDYYSKYPEDFHEMYLQVQQNMNDMENAEIKRYQEKASANK
jgi:hypothetical protein